MQSNRTRYAKQTEQCNQTDKSKHKELICYQTDKSKHKELICYPNRQK